MINYIHRTASNLKIKFNTNDPFEIVEALGIYISFRQIGRLKGFYHVVNREYHIVINQTLCDMDKRVVCAHELGHDRLHKHFARMAAFKDFIIYDISSKPEFEANLFAADILLNDTEILELQNDCDFISMGTIIGINPNIITFKLISMRQRGFILNISQSYDNKFLKNNFS